jgi:hypothetical protein
MIELGALRAMPSADHDGTVFAPGPPSNAVDDGWRKHDLRYVAKAAGLAGVAAAAVAGARRRV